MKRKSNWRWRWTRQTSSSWMADVKHKFEVLKPIANKLGNLFYKMGQGSYLHPSYAKCTFCLQLMNNNYCQQKWRLSESGYPSTSVLLRLWSIFLLSVAFSKGITKECVKCQAHTNNKTCVQRISTGHEHLTFQKNTYYTQTKTNIV